MDTKPIDTRNWKCFFGMHQSEISETIHKERYRLETDSMPYRRWTLIISRCVHCGKITSGEF
ncbi:MAG: hypothetical protein ACFWUG_00510 [Rahnella inusitata]|jgi:hypothetical protein